MSPVLGAADRVWWAHVIRRAHVVDVDFVAAAAGRRLRARGAVRAYVRGGFRRGMSLNPLFVEARVSRQLSDAGRVPALYAYLVNDRERLSVSPHWDAPAYARRHPDALEDPAGPLGHAWRAARRGAPLVLGPADRPRPVSWTAFAGVARLAVSQTRDAVVSLEHASAVRDRTRHATLVAVVGDDERDDDRVIELMGDAAAALEATGVSTAVVIAARHPDPDDWVQLALATLWIPDSRVRRVPLEPGPLLDLLESEVRAGMPEGTVVTRGPAAEVSLADLLALAEAGSERPTAPLWLAPDGTVAAAGVGIADSRRVHLLAGHPAEDARALGSYLEVLEPAGRTRAYPVRAYPVGAAAPDSGSVPDGAAAPARTLLTATVTAPAHPPSSEPIVAPDTDLDALVAPLGMLSAGSTGAHPTSSQRFTRAPEAVSTLADGEVVPALRWAIKTAAPAGAAGESWGDTHFARGLAAALRRLGQQVVIDAFDARDRPSGYLDDVSVVLRGPRRIDPPRAERPRRAVSVLWIISHPDEVTEDELDGFDEVFAASTPWAAAASTRFGRDIHPLLQCTDSTIFHPTGAARTDEIVFVGTARGIARPSVVEPIAAGVPVSVYGPDWRGYIPAARIAATGIANDRLPALYERAAVVLNDHWPAMRREGFISNRPYDVVAAGGRVISDEVEGLAAEFEGAVAVYRDIPHLLEILGGALDRVFPDDAALARISARIRAEHSFDARARSLLAAASRAHGA